ncbi:MAG: response regulator [Rhodocyclaceae bacterium]|nr:response regulator [Rhodocyclaceae bacterium]
MKILIVDDDAVARMIALESLAGEAGLETAECADAACLLSALAAAPADLVLLDIEMPGMDGIAACRALRAAGHDTVQVMFVSVHNDLATRLAAYDAGGNDFIVKPFDPAELRRKIAVARQIAARREGLAQQAEEAQRTAFTAMSTIGEMGSVLETLRAYSTCATPASLARKLIAGAQAFGLEGFVELRTAEGRLCDAWHGSCTPLECSILEHAAGMDRLFQFRDRLVINYPAVTLLVQALPLADAERMGRLRDHLATLVEAADQRLAALETARRQHVQAHGIQEAIAALTRTLDEIHRIQAHNRLRATEIDESLLTELVKSYARLGLTDDQEAALTRLVQDTHARLNALREEDGQISDHLRQIVQQLQRLAAL